MTTLNTDASATETRVSNAMAGMFHVEQNAPGVYLVYSYNSDTKYRVDLFESRCTCDDPAPYCKHLFRAAFETGVVPLDPDEAPDHDHAADESTDALDTAVDDLDGTTTADALLASDDGDDANDETDDAVAADAPSDWTPGDPVPRCDACGHDLACPDHFSLDQQASFEDALALVGA